MARPPEKYSAADRALVILNAAGLNEAGEAPAMIVPKVRDASGRDAAALRCRRNRLSPLRRLLPQCSANGARMIAAAHRCVIFRTRCGAGPILRTSAATGITGTAIAETGVRTGG